MRKIIYIPYCIHYTYRVGLQMKLYGLFKSSIKIPGFIFAPIGLLQLAFALRSNQNLLHHLPLDEARADCIHRAPLLEA